jgi:hypothetical protein
MPQKAVGSAHDCMQIDRNILKHTGKKANVQDVDKYRWSAMLAR